MTGHWIEGWVPLFSNYIVSSLYIYNHQPMQPFMLQNICRPKHRNGSEMIANDNWFATELAHQKVFEAEFTTNTQQPAKIVSVTGTLSNTRRDMKNIEWRWFRGICLQQNYKNLFRV